MTELDDELDKILLDMEWCHAVKTESLGKAKQAIKALIADQVAKARIDERSKCQEIVNKLAQLNIDNHRYSREIAHQPTKADKGVTHD